MHAYASAVGLRGEDASFRFERGPYLCAGVADGHDGDDSDADIDIGNDNNNH